MKVLYHHVRPDNAAVRFIEMRAHFTRPQAWNFGGYSIALGPELILSITITWNIPPPFFPFGRPERNETLSLLSVLLLLSCRLLSKAFRVVSCWLLFEEKK